ncbi:hypothetical protein [Xanthomonas euvesicatoria]|uniref:hypothetical protein n=1 Tax=Xanthomonas euvesicatoria TaxID=456327 RepID=UPI002B49D11B|nr:hypothetical protein [Xanthomonas euvesicatoria]
MSELYKKSGKKVESVLSKFNTHTSFTARHSHAVKSLNQPACISSPQSIGGMLGNAGSTILWFADVFKIGPALVMIGAAMVFYLLRRVLTVGIW